MCSGTQLGRMPLAPCDVAVPRALELTDSGMIPACPAHRCPSRRRGFPASPIRSEQRRAGGPHRDDRVGRGACLLPSTASAAMPRFAWCVECRTRPPANESAASDARLSPTNPAGSSSSRHRDRVHCCWSPEAACTGSRVALHATSNAAAPDAAETQMSAAAGNLTTDGTAL
jgi:hypothetical protein